MSRELGRGVEAVAGELRMILSLYGRGVGVVAAVVSQPLTQTFSRHTSKLPKALRSAVKRNTGNLA